MRTSPKRLKDVLLCLQLVIFSSLISFAQAWNPFPAGDVYLYTYQQGGTPGTSLYGVRIVERGLAGADSVYYLNKVNRRVELNETVIGCQGPIFPTEVILLLQDNYLGDHLIIRPGGDYQFVGTAGDTSLIRTQLPPGSTWPFATGITATLDSVYALNVLGQPDSAMAISLSNSRRIVLSKAHGFVSAPSLLPYVNETYSFELVDFELWGLPGAGLGGSLGGETAVMDFDAGDWFGWRKTVTDYFFQPSYYYTHDSVVAVTPGTNSTLYDLEREQLTSSFIPYQGYSHNYTPPGPATLTHNHGSRPFLELLPLESDSAQLQVGARVQVGAYLDPQYNQRVTYSFDELIYDDQCAPALVRFEDIRRRRFTEGLGRTAFYHVTFGSGPLIEDEVMYCYGKATDSLGPCENLATIAPVEEGLKSGLKLTVWPSPVVDVLRVEVAGRNGTGGGKLRLMDLQGRVLMLRTMEAGDDQADLSLGRVAAGLYMLEFREENAAPVLKKIVVQK